MFKTGQMKTALARGLFLFGLADGLRERQWAFLADWPQVMALAGHVGPMQSAVPGVVLATFFPEVSCFLVEACAGTTEFLLEFLSPTSYHAPVRALKFS